MFNLLVALIGFDAEDCTEHLYSCTCTLHYMSSARQPAGLVKWIWVGLVFCGNLSHITCWECSSCQISVVRLSHYWRAEGIGFSFLISEHTGHCSILAKGIQNDSYYVSTSQWIISIQSSLNTCDSDTCSMKQVPHFNFIWWLTVFFSLFFHVDSPLPSI